MPIRDLFLSNVTRDIPPVVYFHEQNPDKAAAEVSEYIITGGWPATHPNHGRVPDGIHEQYVRLLTGIAEELAKPGGPELPNVWISGFYGSGKSSFAKLLGLALDDVRLPDGTSLAEAWLARDSSPDAPSLREAWQKLRSGVEPLAVVFDIGGFARDNEHLDSAAVRQVQLKLGYCSVEALVADFELRLERDGEWKRFERTAHETLGFPWWTVKDRALAEEDFSLVMSVMFPEKYLDPMSWFSSRGGTHAGPDSAEEAVKAIQDMLTFRRPKATLFLVVDEVSQYVLPQSDRVERLRAFAEQLGARLKGKAWLLALGQQKLDEQADASFLVRTKDRFPPRLRVHLAPTNIRDVVHRRLLQKKPQAEIELRALFARHRPDLKLFAYCGDSMKTEEFVEVYPMLPGHIDLILQITSALRARSARAQGDDQAIRGLLQLLGELFRNQKLAEMPVGALVTLDQIYEVQHTALDADVQASMARILGQCSDDSSGLMIRAAKAVALLELIQDTVSTDARLVAQCLYDRVDRGNQVAAVTEALEALRRRNLLGFSEKQGYKVQSTAGEEWDRERRDIGTARETVSEIVQGALTWLLATAERASLHGRPFPWEVTYSDGRRAEDVPLQHSREDASVRVDLRFLARDERVESTWVRHSAEPPLDTRLIWVAGDGDHVDGLARELHRSRAMVKKYEPRRESLSAARKLLLQQEKSRAEEDIEPQVRRAVADAWMAGAMYFRGRSLPPQDQGSTFAVAAHSVATLVLPSLFQYFVATQVLPAELMQLLEPDLSGPSPKFMAGDLGILDLDAGRYVPASTGMVPRRVQDYIAAENGLAGTTLLAHFGRPPYGYTANVVKACVAGLLRGGKVKLQPDGGNEITAVRDAGARDLFEKDRDFRRATIFPSGEDDIGYSVRARICTFFEESFGIRMERDDTAIANEVSQRFPTLASQLRSVEARLQRLPGPVPAPAEFVSLGDALEQCVRVCRQTKPTVLLVRKHLDVLRDAVPLVRMHDAELTAEAIRVVSHANDTVTHHAAQLVALGVDASNVTTAAARVTSHLASGRPWRDAASLQPDLDEIRAAYGVERRRLLQMQEREAEAVRQRLRGRDGFTTLSADQAHHVLRPIEQAVSDTDAEAIAPALIELQDPFMVRLHRAEDAANTKLDALLSESQRAMVTSVDLGLRHRELANEADVDALVTEVRVRLLEPIRAGARVRLL